MNDMKISGSQVFWMISLIVYGHTVLVTIAPAIKEAKQDAWISFVVASLIGIFIVFVSTKLSLLYPNQTFVQYSQTILGKWLGKIITIPYLIMWVTAIPIILRESADVILTLLLHNTPMSIVICLLLIVIAYVTFHGIEVIGRCSELVGPLIYAIVVILIMMLLGNTHFEFLLPVYADTGWWPILKGALLPASLLGESVIMTMLLAFMSHPKKGLPRSLWGVAAAGISLTIGCIVIISLFSPSITSKMLYPAFEAVKYIDVANFIQNLHSIVLVVWLLAVFIKLSVYFFVACYGTAQWLGIKKWKRMIWFVLPVVFCLTFVPQNIAESEFMIPNKYWIPLIFPLNMIGIPLLLWIVGSFRKRRGVRNQIDTT